MNIIVADGFIKTIEQSIEQNNSHFFDAQISRYENSGNEFLFSQLKILSKRLHEKYIRWNLDYPEREEKIKFIDNKSIRKQIVGVTWKRVL
jgi:hypothetical protein